MKLGMFNKLVKTQKTGLFMIAPIIFLSAIGCSNNESISTKGAEKIRFQARPFGIEDVKLLDGPFNHATELNKKILLNYEPDRFIAKFRIEAGLEPKAPHYNGWEDNTIAGHSLGHYLTAIVQMYHTTNDPEFVHRINYIVDELYECQQADGEGYFGAFPDGKNILENQVAKGDIRSQGFNLNGIWVPFYTQHKLMDGLFHAYKYCGNEKALEINIKFANWLQGVVKGLDKNQIETMLRCEYGGINESLAELYSCTHDEKYLALSRLFQDTLVVEKIISGQNVLSGKHANTQIPKFVGLARRYELTANTDDYNGAVNFWNMMVNHHTYVSGGNGNHEYLGDPDKLNNELSNNTTETCNVYNMLKLSSHLFSWSADPNILDYYERALFNHILSAQHPETGHVIYNLSLDMGGFKVYQNPFWFTCCVGTGMETHSKYSGNIYYHSRNELYIGQFIASELNWKEKGISFRQTTHFPEEESSTIEILNEKPVRFKMKIRYPHWCHKGMSISINGEQQDIKEERGSFVTLNRKWRKGDRVDISFPFSLRTESMPDNPGRIAVFNGPVLLAGVLGTVPDEHANDPMYVPVLMTKEKDPTNWLTPVEGKINTFKTKEVGFPRDVVLKPFYRTHDLHYTVYWDTYSNEEWIAFQTEYEEEQKKKKEIERRTIDLFRIGEMQPERDHNFEGQKTWVTEYKSKKSREADRGGWFSFDMKVLKNKPTMLSVEYWGGFNGSKTFDIMIEGKVIATENVSAINQGKFVDIAYDIPPELIGKKENISVRFVPHEGHRAGPVFSVRTIIKE
jgi:DUF1680 family protein